MSSPSTEIALRGGNEAAHEQRLLCPGQSYLERLGIVYMDQIRLTIVTELYQREMSIRQFCATFGGDYPAVRRHFVKLVEAGWLRKVRPVDVGGRGRPEDLYRSTELAVIDTATWRTIPFSIRDAFTIQLLEEMASRVGEALGAGIADALPGRVSTFKTVEVDELAWCKAHKAVELCFQILLREQIDAKIRLDRSGDQPLQMVVNLAAFEAPGPAPEGGVTELPTAAAIASPPPWNERIGKVFANRLDLEIVNELNQNALTPGQLESTLGGPPSRTILRRCKRLTDDGWAVTIDKETGGALHGASVYRFRAAKPNVSVADIFDRIPAAVRKGPTWACFEPFIATSIAAVETGRFNNRFDRHLTMTPLVVDEIGRCQVTRALHAFEKAVLKVEDEMKKRRRGKNFKSFRAAFLQSSFQSPLRDVRSKFR